MRINSNYKKWRNKYCILCAMLLMSALLPLSMWAQDGQTDNRRITVELTDVPVGTILDEIKAQTGANFVADATIIRNLGRRSLNVSNATLAAAISQLLEGSGYGYRIVGNNVTFMAEADRQDAEVRITGRVADSRGEPLVGVTVTVKGAPTMGTATDARGEYSLTVVRGRTLVFSFIGMVTREIVTDTRTEINITMEEAAQEVDEVVVTGMFRKSAESFTGAAVTVTAAQLERYGSRNVLATLRNIDPAFNIIENNSFGSDPNRIPDVQIRGSSSIPNVNELEDDVQGRLNTPLIIIDGFESSLRTMMDMNEDDIALITILKDASATAMYGSRGANGVVVIETKDPVAGNLRISYRGGIELEMPDLGSYNLANSREKLELEQLTGVYNGDAQHPYWALQQQYNYLMTQVNNGVDTDWLSKPLEVGAGHRHNLRVDGGDKTFRYSAAARLDDIKGAMKGSNRRNFNGTINLSYSFEKVRFTNSTMIDLNNTAASPYGTFEDYARMNPYFAPYGPGGKVIRTLGLDGPGAADRWGANGVGNPLWNASLNTFDKTNTTTITNNFSIDWNIADGFIVRGRLGLSKSVGGSDAFYPDEHTRFNDYPQSDLARKGMYVNGNSRGNSIDASLNVSYTRLFADKHQLFAGVNANARQSEYSETGITAEGFADEDLAFLGMALQYAQGGKPTGRETRSRAMGLAGNVNYSYDNRYFIDLTLAVDGNSAFGKDNPFAAFWSAGIGWNLHNERFLADSYIFDRLKLRGSVGSSGSQMFDSYQALTTYRYSDDRYFIWSGADIKALGNSALKWQQKISYNFGVEADLFDNRIMFIFDLYNETTRNQVSSVDIPGSTGFISYVDNIGKVRNLGFESKLTAVVLRDRDRRLEWRVSGAVQHNRNKIVKLSEAMKEAQAGIAGRRGSIPDRMFAEGYSTDAIWVVPSLGIDPSTGREKFLGRDGNPTWIWDAANLSACGVSLPKYVGNINTDLRWRNFHLTLSFGYNFGGQIYNETLINKVENANYIYNVDRRVTTDRWREPGDKAMFKSVYLNEETLKTSRFVQDERTFRLQSASLIYDFDAELARRLYASRLSLEVSMDDLFYLSSVKRERGTDYPFSRHLSFSLNVTF